MLNVVCVRREFDLWASDRSSPIVDWLRALARQVHEDCGGSGVGALGMCVSGNFALAMMTEEKVVAPVLSQPSLPLPLGRRRRAALGLSPQEIQCVRSRFEKEDLRVIGLRFLRDPMVPEERFATLKETFGDRFEEIKINPDEVKPRGSFSPPHSVLTIELRDDDPAGPTRKAERRVIEFFKERLGVGSPESPVPAAPAHGPGNTGIS
jgi:dienelactone hydrolase